MAHFSRFAPRVSFWSTIPISKFLVLYFACTWGTSKMAYDRVRRVASGARVFASGAYSKVLKAVRSG